MTDLDTFKQVQVLCGVPASEADGLIGPKSRAAFEATGARALAEWHATKAPGAQGELVGDGTWPFTAKIVGDDIVCENITITCFGGWGGGHIADPQDNGDTASGRSTKNEEIEGVSIAMDGRAFPHLSAGEHRALDGSPFPKMPFGTLVEVTINGKTYTPADGIVDLGPGKQASHPHDPHALDLTPLAARMFAQQMSLRDAARYFSGRGNFRIIGGAKYVAASGAQ